MAGTTTKATTPRFVGRSWEAFRVWTRRWESFSRLSRLDTADQQTQHDIFISCVSDDKIKVIDNFPIPTSSRLDVKIILQHLKIYARGQVNDTVEHHNLSKRQQQTGERFEDFLTSIRDLSKTCTFCEPCTELILRDKIVTCCLDVELRRKLLQFASENTLTIEKAVSIARADEATNLHEQEFESSSHGQAYANRLQKGPGRVHKTGRTSGAHAKPGKHASGVPCKYCGGAPHRERTQCPAIDRTFSKCSKKGHREKFVFNKGTVSFAGYTLSSSGYSIDPQLVEAITNFPEPTTVTALRYFFGLVNQLSLFTDQIAELLQPLRPLLSMQNEYVWDQAQSRAFTTAKCAPASPPTLAFYDPTCPTSLRTDASNLHGLGFILMQKQEDSSWRVVQCGSRFLTAAESRYAAIELELLGIVRAIKKCRLFLAGLPTFSIFTDHKPLIPILNSKQLDEIENPRLQRLRMKILEYTFVAAWVKGKDNEKPDALSRAPVSQPMPGDELGEDQDATSINNLIMNSIRSVDVNLRLDAVRSAADVDSDTVAARNSAYWISGCQRPIANRPPPVLAPPRQGLHWRWPGSLCMQTRYPSPDA